MNLRRFGWLGFGVSVGFILMVAAVTYATLEIGGVSLGRSSSAQRGEGLAMCVQGVGVEAAMETPTKANIDSAMVEVAKHPTWPETGLDKLPPPVVDTGCSVDPGIYRKSYGEFPTSFYDIIGRRVDTPSQYKILVFVLPDSEIARLSGGSSNIRTSIEEFQCHLDDCAEVTTGLYLGLSEVTDVGFLTDQLEYAIGLNPRY